MPTRKLLAVALTCVLALACGCADDDDCPSCPRAPVPDATLDNVWPNADSLSWMFTHKQVVRQGTFVPTLYATREEVPPVPSFQEILPFLENPVWPDSGTSLEGLVRLRFEGEMTTAAGVTTQRLTETRFAEQSGWPLTDSQASFETALLGRLWVARPDLREKIHERLKAAPAAIDEEEFLIGSAFLGAAAWEKTAAHIGAYGELSPDLFWLFLEADLTEGHTFVIQPVPELADDVFLHGKITANGEEFATGFGTFAKTVQCAYLIDYGISLAVDEDGDPLGYHGMHASGFIVYAPMVGPIYCYEINLVNNGDAAEEGAKYIERALIGTNVPWASGL